MKLKSMVTGVVTLIAVSLISAAATTLWASPLVPQSPPFPPMAPALVSTGATRDNGALHATLGLPSLKAVLIVGPIDGDYGSWTNQEKNNMELTAAELEAHGVKVFRFYPPNNDWEQIKAAASGAHFLFYRGHGVYWSPMPAPIVGGFALTSGFRSSEDIRDDLHLASNAIVMMYGCFTAGSSSNDNGPISGQEAQRRVQQYAAPFIDMGAAGYYANWFGDAFQQFVHYLFQGMTLGEAYEEFFDFQSSSVERYLYSDDPDNVVWLDKDNWGYLKYNNAFVGLPDRTLKGLFGTDAMSVSPANIVHLAEPFFPNHSFRIEVEISSSDPITWSASVSPDAASWLAVQPANGTIGQQFTAVIMSTNKAKGTYQAHINVVAQSQEVENREQVIPVTLVVVDRIHQFYLPSLAR